MTIDLEYLDTRFRSTAATTQRSAFARPLEETHLLVAAVARQWDGTTWVEFRQWDGTISSPVMGPPVRQ